MDITSTVKNIENTFKKIKYFFLERTDVRQLATETHLLFPTIIGELWPSLDTPFSRVELVVIQRS